MTCNIDKIVKSLSSVQKFHSGPDLVRWAKKVGLVDKEATKKIRIIGRGKYKVKVKPVKQKGFNFRTGRQKNMNVTRYLMTDVPPNRRTTKNIPKYSTGKNKVDWKKWLMIVMEPGHNGLGKSKANGKWYGWSHRAMHGFNSKQKAAAFAESVS